MKNYPERVTPTSGFMTIHEMPDSERPREKAMRFGINTLTDAELIAIIFSTGLKGKSVLQLSQEIIEFHQGHLSYLASMSVKEICTTFKGIGPAKALTLLAGLELGVRAAHDAAKLASEQKALNTPQLIWEVMHEQLHGLSHEEFWALYLNQAGKLICRQQIGRGGLSATLVDVRVVLREALLCNASSIILVHNHPSGTLKPSPQDIALTKKIVEAAKIHDLRVPDHLIFTDNEYYSFHTSGQMPD